jgi:hypothetical protein
MPQRISLNYESNAETGLSPERDLQAERRVLTSLVCWILSLVFCLSGSFAGGGLTFFLLAFLSCVFGMVIAFRAIRSRQEHGDAVLVFALNLMFTAGFFMVVLRSYLAIVFDVRLLR